MGTLKVKVNGEWITVQIRGDKGPAGTIATVVQTTGDSTDNVISQKAITEELNRLKSVLLNELHPVGSIYTSLNSASPAELFGGTWEQIQDRFIYAAGSKLTGATGGEETHVLSNAEMPAHNHGQAGSHTHSRGSMEIYGTLTNVLAGSYLGASGAFSCSNNLRGTGYHGTSDYDRSDVTFYASRNWSGNTSENGAHTHSTNGSGNAHNNMPPYLVAYMWKRIA